MPGAMAAVILKNHDFEPLYFPQQKLKCSSGSVQCHQGSSHSLERLMGKPGLPGSGSSELLPAFAVRQSSKLRPGPSPGTHLSVRKEGLPSIPPSVVNFQNAPHKRPAQSGTQ